MVRKDLEGETKQEVKKTKISGIGLAVALGVHSVFEGMALGMMPKVEDAG